MLREIDSNTILNVDRIVYAEKIRDNEIKAYMSNGDVLRFRLSMKEFMDRVDGLTTCEDA